MYGTVARLRAKPGMEQQFQQLMREYKSLDIPGMVATCVYRMDNNPNDYYLATVFSSKESYLANARSPEQETRYHKMRALLEADPEWNDGEAIFTQNIG